MKSNVPETNISIPGLPKEHVAGAGKAVASAMTKGAVGAKYDVKTGQVITIDKDGKQSIVYTTNVAKGDGKPKEKSAPPVAKAESKPVKKSGRTVEEIKNDPGNFFPRAKSQTSISDSLDTAAKQNDKLIKKVGGTLSGLRSLTPRGKMEAIEKRSRFLQMTGKMSKADADAQAKKEIDS
jgi:hypothetical protein